MTDVPMTDRTGLTGLTGLTGRTYADRTEALVRGVSPVLEVPFHDNGDLDPAGFTTVVDRVLATGVSSVMFPGFAGEFHKLDGAERELLTGLLLDRTRERSDVAAIVSVPDHATRHAVAQARSAAERGADVINVLPPHFLGPSRDAVLAHVRAVLAAVHPLPVVVQYAPAQTGTALDAPTLRLLAAEHPNLRWVKVESSPPGRLIAALAEGDRPLPALVGLAGLQLPDALRRGAVGVQPGCSFTELYVELWRRWESGDEDGALALHTRMLPYLSYWMQGVELIVAAEKEISVRRGWFGSAHCRAPGHRLDHEELRLIDRFCAEFSDLIPELTR
ncbi:dihydrodipicolinate synthase family protein [Streptomyces sp. NBC_01500]|uniref:dihydrodipicolinate synthase family protein n=1 Tax=Streptomyces sp. NBC_01500 TaxID=2903886 RepID=UPI00224FA0E3|nr:dihydrodipicolinate synthase family protein [Streptomyces sp. NBC_01500]MCX4548197.1 dihydrodipicolinate synthase family protein [Streptomyces sp. NBC_01500]